MKEQGSSPDKDEAVEPTIEGVLHLLDSEIQDIHSAETRHGLNVWVVLAAIVGLLWLLLAELRAAPFDAMAVTRLIFAQSLLIDGLRWLYIVLTFQPRDSSEARFHWSHYSLGTRRAFAAIEVFRCCALLLLAFLSHAFDSYALVPIAVFYSTYFLIMLFALVGSFTPLFVVSDSRNNYTYVIYGVLFASLIAALVFLLPHLSLPAQGAAVSHYIVSGLIVGISYLSIMLGGVLSSSSAVPTLSKIRRQLVTGRLSLSDAISQVEITLGGMLATDALREDFFRLTALLDAMDQQTQNAMMAIMSIESNLPESGDDPVIAVSKRESIQTLIVGYNSFINERQALFDQYKQQLSRFGKQARKIRALPGSRLSANEIERLINSRAASADQNFAQLMEREAESNKKLREAAGETTTPRNERTH